MTPKLFVSACILGGGLLLKFGAPLPSILLGIGLAAFLNWKGARFARAISRNKS